MYISLNEKELREYTVSEISQQIQKTIEKNYSYVKVKGEISGFKIATSGHGYFNLRDENSVLACVCWKSSLDKINTAIEDGIEVFAYGQITTYKGQSRYQLTVTKIELVGVGALMNILEERKKKLYKEGLFDPSKKKPLPYLPNIIGIITSPKGAVIQDILHRISDRYPLEIIVWPITVQGVNTASDVARAITGFNNIGKKPDVIIIARGGGSIEDLWGFNEEIVIRAAYNSNILIISAIGHETDFTLLDFVADVRAPTPTAAAEFAVPVLTDIKIQIAHCYSVLSSHVNNYISYSKNLLNAYSLNIQANFLNSRYQKLDEILLKLNIQNIINQKLASYKEKKINTQIIKYIIFTSKIALKQVKEKLFYVMNEYLNQLAYNISRIESIIDIEKILKQGFAIISHNNKIISNSKSLNSNDIIDIRFYNGILKAVIINKDQC